LSRALVDQLVYLTEEAFENSRVHSLIVNLSTVTEDDWSWHPAEEGRSIAEIAMHVASAKQVYNSQAFGDKSIHWEQVRRMVEAHNATLESGLAWLREGHALLRDNLAALDDDGLMEQRGVHWGGTLDTRAILAIMLQHDIYHAGEINHLRSVIQGTDFWPGRRT
jgi:uncharacterized damage-inducible protein DinB